MMSVDKQKSPYEEFYIAYRIWLRLACVFVIAISVAALIWAGYEFHRYNNITEAEMQMLKDAEGERQE